MDWPHGGSFGQKEVYSEFGELREEEVEELRSERTIKSGLKVSLMLCRVIEVLGDPNDVFIFLTTMNYCCYTFC